MEPGLEVDIVTGLPTEPADALRRKREIQAKKQAKVINRYEDLVNDITGNGGAVIKQVAELFINRINELIREDSACCAYQAIFDNIKMQINAGKKIVEYRLADIEENIHKGM